MVTWLNVQNHNKQNKKVSVPFVNFYTLISDQSFPESALNEDNTSI